MDLMGSNDTPSMIGSVSKSRETLEGRLRREKASLNSRLEKINQALNAIEKSPEIASFMESLQAVI